MRIKALLWCSLLVVGIAPSVHGEGDFTAFERAPDPLLVPDVEPDAIGDIDWSKVTFEPRVVGPVSSAGRDKHTVSSPGGLDALPYAQGFTSRVEEPTILLLILLGLVLIALARWRR